VAHPALALNCVRQTRLRHTRLRHTRLSNVEARGREKKHPLLPRTPNRQRARCHGIGPSFPLPRQPRMHIRMHTHTLAPHLHKALTPANETNAHSISHDRSLFLWPWRGDHSTNHSRTPSSCIRVSLQCVCVHAGGANVTTESKRKSERDANEGLRTTASSLCNQSHHTDEGPSTSTGCKMTLVANSDVKRMGWGGERARESTVHRNILGSWLVAKDAGC
jgi:hypothetical protein